MNITILKDVDDPRENRGGKLKKGDELTVDKDKIWTDLVKNKKAEETKPTVTKIIKTVEEAEDFNNE